MKTQRISDKLGRGMLIISWAIYCLLLVLFLVSSIQERAELSDYLILLSHFVLFSVFAWSLLAVSPVVTLSPDGVCVRVLFRKRFYPWDTIKQTGVLYLMGKGFWYNAIVLLKPNGVPLEHKDVTLFLLKNIRHRIHIPYSEGAKDYITHYYGPLDFDFTDGVEVKP